MSPADLAQTERRPILPEGGSKKMVSVATDNLIRKELIVICRPSKTGTPVLDLPDGMCATDLDPGTGSPPDFRKGAPNIQALRDAITEDVNWMRELRSAGDKNPRLTSI